MMERVRETLRRIGRIKDALCMGDKGGEEESDEKLFTFFAGSGQCKPLLQRQAQVLVQLSRNEAQVKLLGLFHDPRSTLLPFRDSVRQV